LLYKLAISRLDSSGFTGIKLYEWVKRHSSRSMPIIRCHSVQNTLNWSRFAALKAYWCSAARSKACQSSSFTAVRTFKWVVFPSSPSTTEGRVSQQRKKCPFRSSQIMQLSQTFHTSHSTQGFEFLSNKIVPIHKAMELYNDQLNEQVFN
jgi:hypothetical protein